MDGNWGVTCESCIPSDEETGRKKVRTGLEAIWTDASVCERVGAWALVAVGAFLVIVIVLAGCVVVNFRK